MTIHILWWHFPALITAWWVVVAIWGWLRQGSAWEALVHKQIMALLALPVLVLWVAAMAWGAAS